MSRVAVRTLTFIAAGFLGFDGAALAVLGLWSGRLMLVLVGLVFFLSSGLVLLYWGWYQHQLDKITAARQGLRQESEALRELLRNRH